MRLINRKFCGLLAAIEVPLCRIGLKNGNSAEIMGDETLHECLHHRLDNDFIAACCQNDNNLYICRVKGEFAEGMTTFTA